MTTSAELQELRRELAKLERGRGKRYSPGARQRFTGWARRRRGDGISWDQMAGELGVSAETLRRWCTKGGAVEETATRLVAVQVVDDAPRVVAVTSPSGFRVEGLSLVEAAAMLRALG